MHALKEQAALLRDLYAFALRPRGLQSPVSRGHLLRRRRRGLHTKSPGPMLQNPNLDLSWPGPGDPTATVRL